jgi:hypothetical protein
VTDTKSKKFCVVIHGPPFWQRDAVFLPLKKPHPPSFLHGYQRARKDKRERAFFNPQKNLQNVRLFIFGG